VKMGGYFRGVKCNFPNFNLWGEALLTACICITEYLLSFLKFHHMNCGKAESL
jgi:hypothetical protein